jgi:hypothetical protein
MESSLPQNGVVTKTSHLCGPTAEARGPGTNEVGAEETAEETGTFRENRPGLPGQ